MGDGARAKSKYYINTPEKKQRANKENPDRKKNTPGPTAVESLSCPPIGGCFVQG